MQNKVGSVLPSPKDIEELVANIRNISKRLSECTVTLSKEERLATTKFRPGGERIVQLVGDLAKTHNLTLPGLSVEDMNLDLQLAQQLQPLAAATEVLWQTLSDTMLEAQSECWWVTTAYYSALARLASTNPQIATGLKPAVDFFATGRRKSKQSGDSKSSEPAKP